MHKQKNIEFKTEIPLILSPLLIYLNLAPHGSERKSIYLITTQLGYLMKISGSIKTETNHIAQDI